MSKPLDWMPFYVGQFLDDPEVARLDTLAIGAYVLLLFEAWRHDGRLPDSDRELARLARVSPKVWARLKPHVYPFWRPTGAGWVSNGRLTGVRLEQLQRAERRRTAARANVLKRWQPTETTSAEDTNGIALVIPSEYESYENCDTNAIQRKSKRERKKEIKDRAEGGESPLTPLPLSLGLSPQEADKPKRKRGERPLHPQAAEVLEALNAARKRAIPGARALRPLDANLQLISDRLHDGNTVEDCLHVIAVREAEAKAKPDSRQWFNQVTPFIAKNFARTLANTPEVAGDIRTLPGPEKFNSGPAGRFLARVSGPGPSLEECRRRDAERIARARAEEEAADKVTRDHSQGTGENHHGSAVSRYQG